ncbi:MAG TPA: tetratricopeptide repeat protein [Terracidiphilus sp.]|nr:tetratricopeptide repeat protein [Terracidiphilus sp.]
MKARKGIGGAARRHSACLLMLAGMALLAGPLRAQQQPQQPSRPAQKPAQQESNPFPDDPNSVPVLPTGGTSAAPAPANAAPDYSNVSLASPDVDPVRSPDDGPVVPDTGSSSSSTAGLDQLLKPPPDNGKGRRHGKDDDDGAEIAPHVETAKEDESVGSYYLDQKNWAAALSRYESALVLDPENPDVYWGLAESERHTGKYAAARTHYLKVMEYDPDSKHSKEAKKYLAEPEIANAKADAASAGAQQP